MSAANITCIIAEDEAIFRDALVKLLAQEWPALKVLGTCEDGGEALDAIALHQPTIAFLDIRMPGLTGLDVAATLTDISPKTKIIFVTAYDQYAVDAFDRGAIDYLLKPVDPARLRTTIARVEERLALARPEADAAAAQQLLAVLDSLRGQLKPSGEDAPLAWITASVGRETRLIPMSDVLYIQSDNKYTAVITAECEALVRTPLHDLLRRLDGTEFKQIHRSTVVNLRAVAGVTRDESGRGTMRIKGRKETLTVSLTFMPIFKNM